MLLKHSYSVATFHLLWDRKLNTIAMKRAAHCRYSYTFPVSNNLSLQYFQYWFYLLEWGRAASMRLCISARLEPSKNQEKCKENHAYHGERSSRPITLINTFTNTRS